MKYILLVFFGLSFCTCGTEQKKIDITSSTNIPLMVYLNYFGEYESYETSYGYYHQRKTGYGYVNADTLEVVIPAQYDEALPFAGNYAIVHDFNGKFYIINKDNKKIFSTKHGLSLGTIFKMENSDTAFVLTKQYSGSRLEIEPNFFLPNISFEPTRKTFKLYNLSTGRQILKDVRYADDDDPKIMLVDEYVIYDDKVYKLNSSGKFSAYNIKAEDLIKQAAEKRNMSYREQDFNYDQEWSFGPYFGYHDTLDINILLQKIPKNTQIRGQTSGHKYDKPVFNIDPINEYAKDTFTEYRIGEYPLQSNFYSLYGVYLEYNDKDGLLAGVYNALENNWVIYPIEVKYKSIFYKTHYENYIRYGFWDDEIIYYNIKTRKKSKRLFFAQTNYNTLPYMVYYGYYNNERAAEFNDKEYLEGTFEDF